jgi:hypothetical protein
MITPGTDEFRASLQKRFAEAEQTGKSYCGVKAGDLHREVGGYPDQDHPLRTCCEVMRQTMRDTDKVLQETPSGRGASLLIRYMLPRT